MKTILALFLVRLALPAFAATTNSDLSISIAVPYAPNQLAAFGKWPETNDTRVLCSTWNSHFQVVVRNVSGKPRNIFQDGNSWGYYALHFELIDESGKKWVAKKIGGSFDGNTATFWTLKPDECLVIDVCFTDDQKSDWQKWKGFPHNQIVSMRAVFETAEDGFSRQRSVWTGRAVSNWNNYFFVNPTMP